MAGLKSIPTTFRVIVAHRDRAAGPLRGWLRSIFHCEHGFSGEELIQVDTCSSPRSTVLSTYAPTMGRQRSQRRLLRGDLLDYDEPTSLHAASIWRLCPRLSYPPGELAESGQCDVEVVNGSVDATSGPRHWHVGQPYRSCDDILEKAGVQRCRTAKHFGVAVPW